MARSAHDKHFADLWQQQSAQRERWSGNLSPDVPVVQPFKRGRLDDEACRHQPGALSRSTPAPTMSGGVESRHAARAGTAKNVGGDPILIDGSIPSSRTVDGAAGVAPGPLTLILPFPPTLNHSSMPDGRGGRYLTDSHNSFRDEVAYIVMQRRLARIDGRLAICIDLYPSDNRRWDIDNRAKAVLDALQHAGLFKDDNAVDDLHITRQIAGNEAWAAVTVSVIGG